MITDKRKILIEWAYRIRDGKPNPKSMAHQIILEGVLKDFGWGVEERNELLKNLQEDSPGVWVGMTKDGNKRYFKDKESLQRALKRGSVTAADKKDDDEVDRDAGKPKDTDFFDRGLDKDDEEKPEEKPEDDEQKAKELKKELEGKISNHLDYQSRITTLEARAEFKDDIKKEEKLKKELREMRESMSTLEGDFKDRAATLVAIAHLYGRRENSGFGKNNLGLADRDQLFKNRENLMELYDEAKPELVEKGVRKVRKNKVSEDFVNESFDTLPKPLQEALARKGKVGKPADKKHFLGYVREDGSVTSDVNDPNIKKDENGNPVIKRGGLPSKDRARLIWRIYLEQGGIDAYTGLPLDLESMDLEHVVGFKNDDAGEPTMDDYLNREHEANQVLTSSRTNQLKSDSSMKDFFESNVDILKDKTPEDFERIEKGFKQANEMIPRTEQTALRLMDEVSFKKKGGGSISKSDYDSLPENEKPELQTTDAGTPRVATARLNSNVTRETLSQEFENEDKYYKEVRDTLLENTDDKKERGKILRIRSKIGKRTLNALGLSAQVIGPDGRRTNAISNSDEFYRAFLESMADASPEEQQELKKAWFEASRLAASDEVRSKGKPEQTNQFRKFLREKGIPSDEVLKNPQYAKLWKYKNDDGEVV